MQITNLHSNPLNRQDSNQQVSSLRSGPQHSNDEKAAATDKLLEKLAQNIPGMTNADELRKLDAKDFTPQKVANRVTDFVAMGLEQARRSGKSEAEVENLRLAAASGIQKGIAEARDILDNMNLLTDDISADIDETL